jgi:hypothetical protein
MKKESNTSEICSIIFFLLIGLLLLKLSSSPDAPAAGSFRGEYSENWQSIGAGVCIIAMASYGVIVLLRNNNKKKK